MPQKMLDPAVINQIMDVAKKGAMQFEVYCDGVSCKHAQWQSCVHRTAQVCGDFLPIACCPASCELHWDNQTSSKEDCTGF